MRKSQSRGRASARAERARLVVEYRPTGSLRAYERNARTHSEAQVRQIRASIDEFGFNNPILLKDDGVTIGAGHGRWAAAQLDPPLAEVPTITLPGLTERQWRAYVIADNKLALNAGWDEDLLRTEVAELLECDIGAELMGFDERELEQLMGDVDTSAKLRRPAGAVPGRALHGAVGPRGLVAGPQARLAQPGHQVRARPHRGRAVQVEGADPPGWRRSRTVAKRSRRRAEPIGAVKDFDGAGAMSRDQHLRPGALRARLPLVLPAWWRGARPLRRRLGSGRRGGSPWLGRPYHGIDLRAEQVEANRAQAAEILAEAGVRRATWRCGDSLKRWTRP
jgi:ParB-like chromosome segregation protein Spo0J